MSTPSNPGENASRYVDELDEAVFGMENPDVPAPVTPSATLRDMRRTRDRRHRGNHRFCYRGHGPAASELHPTRRTAARENRRSAGYGGAAGHCEHEHRDGRPRGH